MMLNAFDALQFRHFWYATGNPTFLVKYLQEGDWRLDDITDVGVQESELTGVAYNAPDVITLLYQTGYLTIKRYEAASGFYYLDYPNDEVRMGFMESLSHIFTPKLGKRSEFSLDRFLLDINNGEAESLMTRFEAFFASLDYQLQGDLEIYFQNTMLIILKMLGMIVHTERHTSNGRVDIVFDTDQYVYIIEIKRDLSAAAALEQIKAKGYDRPYLASGKKIFTIGANFSSASKRLEEWIVE